jgi:hypothetical protein
MFATPLQTHQTPQRQSRHKEERSVRKNGTRHQQKEGCRRRHQEAAGTGGDAPFVSPKYEVPDDKCKSAKCRHEPDEDVIAFAACEGRNECQQQWEPGGIHGVRPVVELVTTGLANVVREHHVYALVGIKTVYFLDCGDMENAENE